MRNKGIICAAAVFAIAGAGGAFGLTGDDVLSKVEQTLTGPKDYEGTATMVLANSDGSGREQRSLKMWAAGTEKRVIKFLSPAGIEGIGLLTEGPGDMSLYMPASNKIRRIEGGSMNEDFQGTDFSYNEMGSFEYRKDYAARIESENDAAWTLSLSRKAGADRPYETLVMTVSKSDYVPQKVEMYRNGKVLKVLSILEVSDSGSYKIPVKLRMENLDKKHYTEMTMSDLKFDQGLEAKDTFSKRFLKKKA